MLSRLQLRHRMLLLPIVAVLGFLLVLHFVTKAGRDDAERIGEVEQRYFPAVQVTHELEDHLGSMRQVFDESVANPSADQIAAAEAIRDRFLDLLETGSTNGNLDPALLEIIRRDSQSYFELARAATLRLIEEGPSEQTVADLEEVTSAYRRVETRLDQWGDQQSVSLGSAISDVRLGSRRSSPRWRCSPRR